MKNFIIVTISVFFLALNVKGQNFPPGFSQVLIVKGLTNPTTMDFAPDGRIFVCKQNGEVRVIKNDVLLPVPAIDLDVEANAERGLGGITLHPDFEHNHWVYLYYTVNQTPKHNRISRFTFNGDVIDPASEVVILDLDPLAISPIHNGGGMKFGQDGKLYVTIGDNNNSDGVQNPDTYWGKMIRINPDGSVPADNPFVSASTPQRKRLWAMGMRNPFTFDIQPGTGRIFINEVGHALWEEIQDASTPGLNFGWPLEQGYVPGSQFTNPFYTYAHGDGLQMGCAVSGGCFFNPPSTNYPQEYIGKYFILDYCEGWIGYIDPAKVNTSHTVFASRIPATSVTLKTGRDGNLYYLGRDNGGLYRIIYSLNAAPAITHQPENLTVATTQSASFSVSVSGTPPFTYSWRKNGVPIPNTNSATYTISSAQATDAGAYSVVVTNARGSMTSSSGTLTVSSDLPPVARITTPATGTTYRAGNTLLFSGTGTDAEDGELPASAFSWSVEFHHGTGTNQHVHDGPPIATGVKSGSYQIPSDNETSSEVFYRLILKVTDKDGFSGTQSVDIYPEKSVITLTTDPPSLRLTLDGMPRNTPLSETGVEGIQRTLGVISPQTIKGVPYVFDHWNDGGAPEKTIITPQNDATYTAVFKQDMTLRDPENPAGAIGGIVYQYYEGLFYKVPDWGTVTPVASGTIPTFDISPAKQAEHFAFRFTGYVEVPSDGMYTFYSLSNDGSVLYIGDRMVINNDGEHNNIELSGMIGLKAGRHAITLGYIQTTGTKVLSVGYAGPGISKRTIPADKLFHVPGSFNVGPSVYISSPLSRQPYTGIPSSINITAQASDGDGSVSRVEFYVNGSKIGEDLTSPYEYLWDHPSQGTYTLTAKAYDNQNATATSPVVFLELGSSAAACVTDGKILREYWTGVTGDKVSTVPVHIPPSGRDYLTIFSIGQNLGDNYGDRIRGYVCAPQTGDYYFWISSNDNGELWLSTSGDSSGKSMIASVPTFSSYLQWDKFPSQKSAAVHLNAGQKYYIEAIHKEGLSSDHLAVGWQLPDGTMERPVPGERLSLPPDLGVTAVEEQDASLTKAAYSFTAYPNPIQKGLITLTITGYTRKTKAYIEITDMAGTRKHSEKIACDVSCPRTIINIDERFQPGTYVVHVTLDDKVLTQRLVIY